MKWEDPACGRRQGDLRGTVGTQTRQATQPEGVARRQGELPSLPWLSCAHAHRNVLRLLMASMSQVEGVLWPRKPGNPCSRQTRRTEEQRVGVVGKYPRSSSLLGHPQRMPPEGAPGGTLTVCRSVLDFFSSTVSCPQQCVWGHLLGPTTRPNPCLQTQLCGNPSPGGWHAECRPLALGSSLGC